MKHIVIIGNGISGITAAREIRKQSSHRVTVISSESNYFFSRTALMYIYMGHMKYGHTQPYENWFWKKNKIDLRNDYVKKVDTENKELYFEGGNSLKYDTLVLAVGSKPNKFGWPGQDLNGVSGMYSLQDLDSIERYTKNIKHAVVVGGGLIGIELVEMLLSRNIGVTFLVREKSFWDVILPKAESELVTRHINHHPVDLKLETELKEIISDDSGRVKAVMTNKEELIDCQFVGLTTGVRPNIDFLKDSTIETDRGILVNEFLETNIPDVYAIGDCAQHINPPGNRKPLEQVWYTGRMQGETVAHTICNNKLEYQPGIWFNSAKFFDIEYQTYGWVWNELKENENDFYWENRKGDKCIKLVFDKTTSQLLGVNSFGIRLRHEVIEEWIRKMVTIETVINDFSKANFDPEFYRKYEQEIKIQFENCLIQKPRL